MRRCGRALIDARIANGYRAQIMRAADDGSVGGQRQYRRHIEGVSADSAVAQVRAGGVQDRRHAIDHRVGRIVQVRDIDIVCAQLRRYGDRAANRVRQAGQIDEPQADIRIICGHIGERVKALAGLIEKLVDLRQQIFLKAKELTGEDSEDPEDFLNNFHRQEIREGSLNEMRVELIKYCTENLDVGQTVFEAFSDSLTQLLGPDIVVQKTANLFIQQPGDPDVVPTHRDAPLSSPFEVVV